MRKSQGGGWLAGLSWSFVLIAQGCLAQGALAIEVEVCEAFLGFSKVMPVDEPALPFEKELLGAVKVTYETLAKSRHRMTMMEYLENDGGFPLLVENLKQQLVVSPDPWLGDFPLRLALYVEPAWGLHYGPSSQAPLQDIAYFMAERLLPVVHLKDPELREAVAQFLPSRFKGSLLEAWHDSDFYIDSILNPERERAALNPEAFDLLHDYELRRHELVSQRPNWRGQNDDVASRVFSNLSLRQNQFLLQRLRISPNEVMNPAQRSETLRTLLRDDTHGLLAAALLASYLDSRR